MGQFKFYIFSFFYCKNSVRADDGNENVEEKEDSTDRTYWEVAS